MDFTDQTTNSFDSNGYNLIGSGNANGAFNQTGDQSVESNPGLGHLADNGGPTETHALLAGSPAIDKGKSLRTTDQRGKPRPFDLANVDNAPGGDGSDIGAFEAEQETTSTVADSYTTNEDDPAHRPTEDNNPANVDVLSNDTDPDGDARQPHGVTPRPRHAAQRRPHAGRHGRRLPRLLARATTTTARTLSPTRLAMASADAETATVTITVNAVNDAPSFTKGADQTVNEDARSPERPGLGLGHLGRSFRRVGPAGELRTDQRQQLFVHRSGAA